MNQQFVTLLRNYAQDAKTAESLGSAMLQSSGVIVPEIAPEIALLITNFPRPIVTNNDPAEYNLAGGFQTHTAGAPKTRFDGSFQMIETDFGQGRQFAELLMSSGGMTNCIVYDGRPDRYLSAHSLYNVAITFEPSEIDSEGTSTIQRLSGQMKYNYYGENAGLGVNNEQGLISGSKDGSKALRDRASKLLDAVYSGNPIMTALRDLI